jgi:hypothetical protein
MTGYLHPAFPRPDDAAVLWRYMPFWKFERLVTDGRLLFPCADQFTDKREGTAPQGQTTWWEQLIAQAATEDQRQIVVENRDKIAGFASAFRSNYYVSCWHMSPCETPDMWQHYASAPDSIAIRTDFASLRALLMDYVEIGVVRYIDYAADRLPSMNMFEYIMHKDIEMRFEREVRAVAFPPATAELGLTHFRENWFEGEANPRFRAFAPTGDLKSLIHSLALHPEAPTASAQCLQALCARAELTVEIAACR